jgi:hypothetical protein
MPIEQILRGVPVKPFDNAAAVTGVSRTFALPARSGSLQWQTFFGTNPSSVSIDLEYSLNEGLNWEAIDNTTLTTGEVRTFSITGGQLIRFNIISITGGANVNLVLRLESL